MKLKKFYKGKLDASLLNRLNGLYSQKMQVLLIKLENGSWTKKQIERQKKSILPKIALYQVFIEEGLKKEEARELVRLYAYHIAHKINKTLKALFHIPGFFHFFRFIMKKGMGEEEIWTSKVLENNENEYAFDVLKCLWADTCRHFDCYELCEIFCLCDPIMFGNIGKLDFKRSQTLGMNGEKCDFCFHSMRKQK